MKLSRFRPEHVLFLIALCFYGATSGIHPFLGESSSLLLSHAWIYQFQLTSHPLWGLVAALLKQLPLPLAATMNIFSVFCGAFSILLFYRVLTNLKLDSDYDERTPTARSLMSLAGPLYLLALLPIWTISNRAHYASFEMVLFMLTIRTLQNYRDRGGIKRLASLGLIFGLGIIESSTFLVAAPILGLYLLYVMWSNSHIKPPQIAIAAAAFILGLGFYFIPTWLYTRLPVYDWGGASSFWHAAWLTYSSSAKTLKAQVGQVGWIILLMVSIIPYVGGMWVKRTQPVENRSFSVLLIALIVMALSIALLFNVKLAPWVLLPSSLGFVLPSIMIAASFAISIAFWTAFFKDRRRKRRQRKPASAAGRRTEIVFSILLAGLTLGAAVVNYSSVRTNIGAKMKSLTDSMIAELPQKGIVISDGQIDSYLLISAADAGVDCSVVNLRMSNHPIYRNYMKSLMASDRAESLMDINLGVAIREWIASSPETAERIALIGWPDWWERAGYIPLWRHGLIYGWEPDVQPDLNAIYAGEEDFWKMALLKFKVEKEPEDNRERILNALGMQIARGINDFGVFMERFERKDIAQEAYETARSIDESNLSASVNLYSCINPDNPDRNALLEKIKQIVAVTPETRFKDLIDRYGYISREDSARTLSEIRTSQSAEAAADENDDKGRKELPDQDDIDTFKRIVELMGEKRWNDAKVLCRELIDKNPDYNRVWIILAVIAQQQKDYETIDECLKHMIEVKQFWPDMVLIAGMSYKDRGSLEQARNLLEAALKANPNNINLLEELLRLDVRMGGTQRGDMYLGRLLELNSGHFYANFVLGTRLHTQGKNDLALSAYEKCLEKGETPTLLNNMAWVLNEIGDHERALELAERSLELNDKPSNIWDTLGSILLDMNDYDRAEEALEQALRIDPENLNAKICLIDLKNRTGQVEQARALAKELRSRENDMSTEQLEIMAEIWKP